MLHFNQSVNSFLIFIELAPGLFLAIQNDAVLISRSTFSIVSRTSSRKK